MVHLQTQWMKIKNRIWLEKPHKFQILRRFSSSGGSAYPTPTTPLPGGYSVPTSTNPYSPGVTVNTAQGEPYDLPQPVSTSSVDSYVRVDISLLAAKRQSSSETSSSQDTMERAFDETESTNEPSGNNSVSLVAPVIPETPPRSICSSQERNLPYLQEAALPRPVSQSAPQVSVPMRQTSTENFDRGLVGSKEEWDMLRLLRIDALMLRPLLQQQHNFLKDKHDAKETAEDALLNFASSIFLKKGVMISGCSRGNFEKLVATLQVAREAYRSAFSEFFKRYQTLSGIHSEMGNIENHLYLLLFGNLPEDSMPRTPHENEMFASSPNRWPGLAAGVQHRYHPLRDKFMSRLGDLDLAKEKLGRFLREKEDLEVEEQQYFRIHRESNESFKTALDSISALENKTRAEIMVIQQDLRGIEQECIEAGVELDGGSDDGSGNSLSDHGDVQQDIGVTTEENTELELGMSAEI